MAGKSKKPGNAYKVLKPKKTIGKPKMTPMKRTVSKMFTRLRKPQP
jgi:hypothetical protein